MIDFCILGSGIAGSTIANLLSKKFKVEIFDKARGPGGRSSNKRYKDNLSFDHGMQYISPKSNQFQKYIKTLQKNKVLKIWEGNHLDFTFKKKENSKKFIGVKANNSISKHNLKKIKQNYKSKVKKIYFNKYFWKIYLENGKNFESKSLILTCPFPQLKILAKRYLSKKFLNSKIKMDPNITLMIVIKNQKLLPLSSIKFNDDVLSWASYENSKKRFNSPHALWTIQSSKKWAKRNINKLKKSKKVENDLLSRFINLTGYNKKKIIFVKSHGWKYSYNSKKTLYKSYWDKKYRLGVCADWFIGPKVENAWISAKDLSKKIKN